MIIKEAVYKTCPTCNKKEMVEEQMYCCDNCKKILKDFLYCTIFWLNNKNKSFYFCSWRCFFKKMRNVKTDYFISMPTLCFDKKEGFPVSEFWKYIKKVR